MKIMYQNYVYATTHTNDISLGVLNKKLKFTHLQYVNIVIYGSVMYQCFIKNKILISVKFARYFKI